MAWHGKVTPAAPDRSNWGVSFSFGVVAVASNVFSRQAASQQQLTRHMLAGREGGFFRWAGGPHFDGRPPTQRTAGQDGAGLAALGRPVSPERALGALPSLPPGTTAVPQRSQCSPLSARHVVVTDGTDWGAGGGR